MTDREYQGWLHHRCQWQPIRRLRCKAVEGAEKLEECLAAGDVKDAGGKDLSQDILDANAKVEDKTVEDGSLKGSRECRY